MTDECSKVIRLSPVAWQHISLVGKYEFTTNAHIPDHTTLMTQLISNLSKMEDASTITKAKKARKTKSAQE